MQPLLTVVALLLFIIYATFRAFQNAHYFAEPYISPFYSPCITTACEGDTFPELFTGPTWISPALYILVFPLGIRLTCYYYRKAYYRSFWLSPPACAVAEPHRRYTGETPAAADRPEPAPVRASTPALVINVILFYDAVLAFRDETGAWGHMGLGTLVLLVNAVLLCAVLAVLPLVPAHRRRPAQPLLPAPAALPVLDAWSRGSTPGTCSSPGRRCSASRSPTSTSCCWPPDTISDPRFF